MTRAEILSIAKPILFNTDMVRAVLEGRKTVTRRVVKGFVPDDALFGYSDFTPEGCISARSVYANGYGEKFYKLPCRPGDILYVRETWRKYNGKYYYKANERPDYDYFALKPPFAPKWRPSIHMPKEAARIFLRVTNVRVERLQDMTIDDVLHEGTPIIRGFEDFKALWDSTIKPADRGLYGWKANPWVWVIEFEKVKPEEA